jgi:hypothetical protein
MGMIKRYFVKFIAILQVSPASLLDVSAGYFPKDLVDESGMIKTQMGTQNRSEMVAMYETSCVISPRTSDSITFKFRQKGLIFMQRHCELSQVYNFK